MTDLTESEREELERHRRRETLEHWHRDQVWKQDGKCAWCGQLLLLKAQNIMNGRDGVICDTCAEPFLDHGDWQDKTPQRPRLRVVSGE